MSAAAKDYKNIVISGLETMRLGELASKNSTARFKALAYKKAIDGIRRMNKPLTSIDDVKGIEGVGKKIEAKIAEVLATGTMSAAERMKARTDVGAFEVLTSVHGIGPVKARELLADGISTIPELRTALATNPALLTEAAKLGLKYYEDGLLRIPRSEMVHHERVLLENLSKTLAWPSQVEMLICLFRIQMDSLIRTHRSFSVILLPSWRRLATLKEN
jgi:DNA polymerase/3'-5' exonuclease PolX